MITIVSGGSRGVSTVSIETSVASITTYSFSAVRGRHRCACASKGGVVATVHMRMKPPSGPATVLV